MLRKTPAAGPPEYAVHAASMRPQRNAAENEDAPRTVGEADELQ